MASNGSSTFNIDMNMSLYIPRVDTRSLPRGNRHAPEYESMVSDFIGKQFKYQRIGEVERVDLLKKQTPQGFDYFIAFVHFSKWFETQQAHDLQEKISTDGAKAKLQFHEKWYWIVNENKTPLSQSEATLHKTIYEQAKQIGMLEEAVGYLRGMKTIPSQISEPALAMTAAQGFGAAYTGFAQPLPHQLMARQPSMVAPEMTWQNYPALSQEGPLHLAPTGLEDGEIPSPPPLTRSVAQGWSDFTTPPRPTAQSVEPPALLRTRSSVPRGRSLTPQDLFGAKAPAAWPTK